MTAPKHPVSKEPEPTVKPAVKPAPWGPALASPKIGVSLADIQKEQGQAKTAKAWSLTGEAKKESSTYKAGPVGSGGASKAPGPDKATQEANDVAEIRQQFVAWLTFNKEKTGRWLHGGTAKKYKLSKTTLDDLLQWANDLDRTPGKPTSKSAVPKDIADDQFHGATGSGTGAFADVRQFKISHRTHIADKNEYGEKKQATFHISLAGPG
jgi:hypothetical protein